MIISKSISQITIQHVLFQSASNCGARHFARLAFKISDYTSRLSSKTMFLLKFYWKRQYRLIGPNLRSSEFPLSASQLKLCHLQWHIQFGVSWYHKLMVQICLKKKRNAHFWFNYFWCKNNLHCPQIRPSQEMDLTAFSMSSIFVSSSQGLTSRTMEDLGISAGFLDFFSL